MKRVFVEEETSTGDDILGISRAKVVGIIEHARIFDAREANNIRDASNNGRRDDKHSGRCRK